MQLIIWRKSIILKFTEPFGIYNLKFLFIIWKVHFLYSYFLTLNIFLIPCKSSVVLAWLVHQRLLNRTITTFRSLQALSNRFTIRFCQLEVDKRRSWSMVVQRSCFQELHSNACTNHEWVTFQKAGSFFLFRLSERNPESGIH